MFVLEPRYVDFLKIEPSILNFALVGLIFIFIAKNRPLWSLSIIVVLPFMLWMSSCNLGFVFYSGYALIITLAINYIKAFPLAFHNKKYKGIVLLSILLVLWAILSPLFYPVRDGLHVGWSLSRERAIEFLPPLLLFPIVIRNVKDVKVFIRSFINVLLFAHIFIILSSVFFIASGQSISSIGKMRIFGLTAVYWESGLLLLCIIYLLIVQKLRPSACFLFSSVAIIGLVIGGSRSRILATLFSIVYFMVPYAHKRIITGVTFVLLALSFFFVLPNSFKAVLFSKVVARIEQSTDTDIMEATSGRSDLYSEAYERWKESPVLGVGSGYAIKPIIINDEVVRRSPHSFFIELLACQGLLGVLVLLIILFKVIRIVFRNEACSSYFNLSAERRLVVSFIIYGVVNWAFKAHWGITFSAIALFSCFDNALRAEHRRYAASLSVNK